MTNNQTCMKEGCELSFDADSEGVTHTKIVNKKLVVQYYCCEGHHEGA